MSMSKYRQGIVYKLYSPNTNLVYIGCSTQGIKTVLSSVRAYYNQGRKCMSNKIVEAGDMRGVVLATYNDISITDLRKKLSVFQVAYSDESVNKSRAGRTPKLRYEDRKDKIQAHYQANKEYILKQSALRNMRKRGLPCTDRVRYRYKISQDEIDACLKTNEVA